MRCPDPCPCLGGTAGSVLANRLSENSKVSVLVIEAGAECVYNPNHVISAFVSDFPFSTKDNLSVQVPFLGSSLPGTDVDWGFKSTSQSGLNGRTLPYARGLGLGGSSAISTLRFSERSWNVI